MARLMVLQSDHSARKGKRLMAVMLSDVGAVLVLLIGMVAFIAEVLSAITDTVTALPVHIFLWADSPERGFMEKPSAAIMVLLGFLIIMNLFAIFPRRWLERHW